MKVEDPAKLFFVLGQEARLRIWRLIGLQELSVSELTAILSLPQSTISGHLKALREAQLVADRRVGTTVYYRQSTANPGTLAAQIAAWAGQAALPSTDQRRLDEVLAARQNGSRAFFDQLADHWDDLRRQYFGDAFAFEALVCLLPPTWRVADIGCGTGYLLPTLARQFERVIAVDAAEAMLVRARQRVARVHRQNVDFRLGRLEQLPLEAAEVDVVIASLVLHHVPSPAQCLSELHRVVRTGGLVLVVELLHHDDHAFSEVMGDAWPGFEQGQLSQWICDAGFAIQGQYPLAAQAPQQSHNAHAATLPAGSFAAGRPGPGLIAMVARKPT